jgi:hypothetical protein
MATTRPHKNTGPSLAPLLSSFNKFNFMAKSSNDLSKPVEEK